MRRAKLSEVAEIIMGQSPPGDTYNDTGEGLPFFQGKAEFGETSPTAKKWCSAPKKIAEPGDILMSVRAPVGPTNLTSERCCIGRGLAAIRADSNCVESGYLRFFLRQEEPRLAGMGQGSTFAAIGRAEIVRLELPLPSRDEQRRIVDILSRAEGIVRLQREAQKKAAEIIPALFLDMFGEPATNPKGWNKPRLDEVCEISYGIADKIDTSITEEEGLRIITISNVLLDGTIDPTVRRFCNATKKQIRNNSVQRGDLLFNWRNGSETHIGKTALWESDEQVLHVSFLLRLRPDVDQLNPYYLWTMLNLMRSREFFINVSRQQINRKFNASELSALTLPVSPIDLQVQFARWVEKARSIQSQQMLAMEKAQTSFDALLGQAFDGPPWFLINPHALAGTTKHENGLRKP
jgi:type I restriction enzyme, S subunit